MALPNPGGPPLETGKRRASRISLNYFKAANGLEKAKVWLAVLAVVLAGGWLAWGAFVRPAQGRLRYSRGPVAAVHASWDSQCSACHTDFSPMSEGNPLKKHLAVGDGKCQGCHMGTIHHKDMKPESVVSCAGCHRDHRGRDVSLVQLSDSDCTSCHRDLKNHMTADPKFHAVVTSFAGDHPEFGLFKASKTPVDPGRLKFDHKLHLMPGQAVDGVGGYTLGKIKKVDPAAYERYKLGQPDDDKDEAPVKLQCASCHVLDAADGGLTGPPRSGGLYFQPINYDVNCKACHPLTFDKAITSSDGKPLVLPHRLQPDDVGRLLWGAYADAAIKKTPGLDEQLKEMLRQPSSAKRPLPGKLPPDIVEARDSALKDFKEAMAFLTRDQAEKSQAYLLSGKTTCGECHHFKEENNRKIIEPLNVPEEWFGHAKFSHVAHRAMKCLDCHDKAASSTTASDVMIPPIANCRQCHVPVKHEGDKQLGGVRSECTVCHTYHNGEHPRTGIGARLRDPAKPLDVQEFLQGKREK